MLDECSLVVEQRSNVPQNPHDLVARRDLQSSLARLKTTRTGVCAAELVHESRSDHPLRKALPFKCKEQHASVLNHDQFITHLSKRTFGEGLGCPMDVRRDISTSGSIFGKHAMWSATSTLLQMEVTDMNLWSHIRDKANKPHKSRLDFPARAPMRAMRFRWQIDVTSSHFLSLLRRPAAQAHSEC